MCHKSINQLNGASEPWNRKRFSLFVIEVKEDVLIARKAEYHDIRELVYTLVQLIPMGFITTYGNVARVLNISPRLVGKILSKNNNPIEIPCHRVIGAKGIGGYTIRGKKAIEFKEKLLRLESSGVLRRFNLYSYLRL